MSARDVVLERIGRALADRQPVTVPRNYQQGGGSASLNLLVERLQDYRAATHRVSADAVAALLSELLPGRTVVPAGFPELWLSEVEVVRDDELTAQQLDDLDGVLTTCATAIAETGTLVLDAGPGQGRRALTLVPDHLVVVVFADQVVAGVPDALRQLDAVRPQTWISGPSATSDIELQRVEGVHGPRRLDVVLVEGTRP